MRFLRIILSISLIIILNNCSSRSIQEVSSIKLLENTNDNVSKKVIAVAESDKVLIAFFLISSGNKICTQKEEIVISTETFTSAFIDVFPKKINDCKIIFKSETELENNKDIKYHYFRNWEQKDESIYVFNATHFSGGNLGGCNYKLIKKKETWEITKSDCSAAAN